MKHSMQHQAAKTRKLAPHNCGEAGMKQLKYASALTGIAMLVAFQAYAQAPPPICQLQVCFSSEQLKTEYECGHGCVFEAAEDVVAAVVDALLTHESVVPYVYLDSVGEPTVGVGNLITSADSAADLPFRRPDGSLATDREIKDMLAEVESHPQPAACIAGDTSQCYPASHFEQYSNLRLDDEDSIALLHTRLGEFGEDLRDIYPDFDTYPANVQKALYDMIYNLGADGVENKFPSFTAAIRARDWKRAAEESYRYQLPDERNNYVEGLLKQAALEGEIAKEKLQQCPADNGGPLGSNGG